MLTNNSSKNYYSKYNLIHSPNTYLEMRIYHIMTDKELCGSILFSVMDISNFKYHFEMHTTLPSLLLDFQVILLTTCLQLQEPSDSQDNEGITTNMEQKLTSAGVPNMSEFVLSAGDLQTDIKPFDSSNKYNFVEGMEKYSSVPVEMKLQALMEAASVSHPPHVETNEKSNDPHTKPKKPREKKVGKKSGTGLRRKRKTHSVLLDREETIDGVQSTKTKMVKKKRDCRNHAQLNSEGNR